MVVTRSRTNLRFQVLDPTGEYPDLTWTATVHWVYVTPPEMVAMAETWGGGPSFSFMSTADKHRLTTATTIAAFLETWTVDPDKMTSGLTTTAPWTAKTANHMMGFWEIWTRGLFPSARQKYFVVITASDMVASLEAWTDDPLFRLC